MTQAFNLSQFANNINSSGQASLTTGVTGVLPITNGGTGSSSASLVAGTNISVTGTFPNQTINNTAPPGITGIGGQAFTSNGTFTIPTGVTLLKVTAVGGGGGASGAYFPYSGSPASGLGGGGGGSAIKYLTGMIAGNTLNVVVGSGGVGDYIDSGGAHRVFSTNGGNSTVSSGTQTITTITGGGGALSTSNTGGAGGTATNGTINLVGQSAGITSGGSSIYGFGGQGYVSVSGGGDGKAGTGYGAGGAGAVANAESFAFTGGAGTGGIVIFEW